MSDQKRFSIDMFAPLIGDTFVILADEASPLGRGEILRTPARCRLTLSLGIAKFTPGSFRRLLVSPLRVAVVIHAKSPAWTARRPRYAK
jgi:hypothetical protein